MHRKLIAFCALSLVILSSLSLSSCGSSSAATTIERSVHLRYGQPNGFQEVRHNADGSISVHYEYSDRGRGPKFDTQYRLAANGTPWQVDSEGVDYLNAPISDHFSLGSAGPSIARYQPIS
jgi:hypothetical protein